MNPHQKNKIDISKMSEEEQKIFRLYGKVPNTKDLLQNKFKERKYFDSGDYALSKAGKASDVGVTSIGSQHPLPENIPHLTSPSAGPNSINNPLLGGSSPSLAGSSGGVMPGGQSGSPVKESSYLTRQTSADEAGSDNQQQQQQQQQGQSLRQPQLQESGRLGSLSPGSEKTVPIRWQG